MPNLAAFQAFRGRIEQELAAGVSRALADQARTKLKAVEAKQGIHPTETIVDGKRGAALDEVQPFGVIRIEINVLSEVVRQVWRDLVARSPVGPEEGGHYRDDHWLFVNGERRQVTSESEITLNPGDEAVIVNMRPYARKIEGGYKRHYSDDSYASRRYGKKVRRPGLSVQASNGVYELTARAWASKYRKERVDIRFEWRGMVDGVAVNPMAAPKNTHAGPSVARTRHLQGGTGKWHRFTAGGAGGEGAFGGRAHNRSRNRYPAIAITTRVA